MSLGIGHELNMLQGMAPVMDGMLLLQCQVKR